MSTLLLCLLFLCSSLPAWAQLSEHLFFVGEDVKVLTIASRHPESPRQAPAVATVITSEELRRRGIRTLGEALSYVAGFYLAPREGGTLPYLRGLPNGVLFLYDGVPLTSDSTKNIHPLDEELSLEAVSRIEIIRGPGSVLWGPDAFAGIVNIVPRNGRQHQGLEGGVLLGSPHADRKAFLNWAHQADLWNAFLSLSAYGRREEPRHYAFGQETGRLGWAEFYELVFNLEVLSRLRLSGRLADFRRPFVVSETEKALSWPALYKNPLSFLKLEAEKRGLKTSLRFKGYYSYLHQRHQELSVATRQKNHLLYGELLLDRELFDAQGLLTTGLSLRKNWVRKATINVRGFLPEYLSPENPQFSPIVEVADFDTRLFSLFAQYRHHLRKDLDLWAGVRFDDHDQYESRLSYNLGLGFFPHRAFFLKLLHGTAYRTPYSIQFLREKDAKPERIRNLSLEVGLRPARKLSFTWTLFYNAIAHHVGEDPFGGFSGPSKEYFLGLETEVHWRPHPGLHLFANYTTFNHYGQEEHYRVLDYLLITPDGTEEAVYSSYQKPFDYGAKNFGNLGLSWQPHPRMSLFFRLQYLGHRRLVLLKTGERLHFPSQITADAALNLHGAKNWTLSLAFKNLFDHRAKAPGTLAGITWPRLTTYLTLRFTF